MGMKYHA